MARDRDARRNIAAEVLEGIGEATAYVAGRRRNVRETVVHVPPQVDVKAIREGLRMTQEEFARRYALPLNTLRKWEQRQRKPDSGTRAYLTMIARHPKAVEEMLAIA